MRPCNDKILVSCDLFQKNKITINGKEFSSASNYEINYREKSPTIAKVINGNAYLKEGDIILCHHNTYYTPSPFHLYEDLFSIPANGKIIFATINDGKLTPMYENVICDKIEVPSLIPLPPSQKKYSFNSAIVKDAGFSTFQKGQTIFFRPYANYDIVYVWEGVETRVTKVHSEQICGVIR